MPPNDERTCLQTDWTRIVAEHGRTVFQTAFRVLGNSADAEEVAQEVFLEAVGQSAAVHNWGAYLRKLTVFRALDRRRQRREEGPLDPDILPAADASPHDAAVRRELAEHLRSLIAALPEREGAVFVLRCSSDCRTQKSLKLYASASVLWPRRCTRCEQNWKQPLEQNRWEIRNQHSVLN